MNQTIKLDIPLWAIVKVFLVGITFYLLFLVKDIIGLLFIVLILTASFRPVVNKWSKKIGRIPAVLILIIAVVAILGTVIYLVVPPVVTQSKQLIENVPDFLSKYQFIRDRVPNLQEGLSTVSKNMGNITGGFVTATVGILGGVVAFFAAIVMTVYLLLAKDSLSLVIKSIVAPDRQEAVLILIRKISQKVGDWFRGQMLLGLIIGAMDLIGLSIIGAPYALTLAVLAAILEIVPTIGPLLSGTVAILVTLGSSPIKALFVALLYIVVQQLENSLIVPKLMQKVVGLSPVIIILAILTGAKLMGIVGAVIAVPVAASISVLIREWPIVRETFNKDE